MKLPDQIEQELQVVEQHIYALETELKRMQAGPPRLRALRSVIETHLKALGYKPLGKITPA